MQEQTKFKDAKTKKRCFLPHLRVNFQFTRLRVLHIAESVDLTCDDVSIRTLSENKRVGSDSVAVKLDPRSVFSDILLVGHGAFGAGLQVVAHERLQIDDSPHGVVGLCLVSTQHHHSRHLHGFSDGEVDRGCLEASCSFVNLNGVIAGAILLVSTEFAIQQEVGRVGRTQVVPHWRCCLHCQFCFTCTKTKFQSLPQNRTKESQITHLQPLELTLNSIYTSRTKLCELARRQK